MQLTKFTKDDGEKYGKELIIAKHFLNESGLFTDEALAEMLDKHPNSLIDFQHIPDDPDYPDQQVTVDFTGADGKTMIEAARSNGKIWINAREVMNRQPEYKALLDQIHDEMAAATGSNKDRRNCRGGILISSAAASTPYHADPTITHLWHVRGHKKAWVYPRNQEVMPDGAYESIILGEIDEDMPFNPAFDTQALVSPADLYGGEMVAWPHRSPHRVKNETYCVSMVMEFSTRESAFTNSVMFTNGVLRRKYGKEPHFDDASLPEKLIKAATGRVLFKLGQRKKFRRKDMVRFKIDPTVSGFVRAVDVPYQRVH